MSKVLFVIDHLGAGGAQKMLLALCLGLAERGQQVRVVSLQPEALYSPLFADGGIVVRHGTLELNVSPLNGLSIVKSILSQMPRFIGTLRGLHQEIRSFQPDLVNTFLFGADFFGTLIAKFNRIRVINSIRATNVWKRPWHKALNAVFYPMVDQFTANSTPTRHFLIEREGVSDQKIKVIANGVALNHEEADREQLRRRFHIPPAHTWLVAAGRLDPQKGFVDLIHAMHHLNQSTPPGSYTVSIFGDGPQREELITLIHQLHLQNFIRLEGYHSPLGPILQGADLFVLSSVYEGMPNVVLEAMAAHTPIVATRIDGVLDIITDQENGVLVPPGQPVQLARAISTLLDDPQLASCLAAKAFIDVKEKFTIEAMVSNYQHLYQMVCLGNQEIAS